MIEKRILTHGTHSGTVAWTKWDLIPPDRAPNTPPPPPPSTSVNTVEMKTLVHFFNQKEELLINGWYQFRIGANYQFHLIGGNLVSAMIIPSKQVK